MALNAAARGAMSSTSSPSSANPDSPAQQSSGTDWAVIEAQGADAASFLHGQLTQDVQSLTASEARLAGYCSAKGRLLATAIVWRPQPDTVFLACDASVAASWVKRLQMFVLRAKCKLRDASSDFVLWGLVGGAAAARVQGLAPWQSRCTPPDVATEPSGALAHTGVQSVIRLPDAQGHVRALAIAPSNRDVSHLPEGSALPREVWDWLAVQSGVPSITAATAEQFVPQMVNFEVLGGVNFKKGCYPGQEVVARSQYRGTVKRRLFLAQADQPLQPADEVFSADDPSQAAGMVVNAAPDPAASAPGSATWSALIELKTAAAHGAALHVKSADGPALQLQPLPYLMPLDAE
jgi:folate-binding protein YgfZ